LIPLYLLTLVSVWMFVETTNPQLQRVEKF
jgi:hypothetical protein